MPYYTLAGDDANGKCTGIEVTSNANDATHINDLLSQGCVQLKNGYSKPTFCCPTQAAGQGEDNGNANYEDPNKNGNANYEDPNKNGNGNGNGNGNNNVDPNLELQKELEKKKLEEEEANKKGYVTEEEKKAINDHVERTFDYAWFFEGNGNGVTDTTPADVIVSESTITPSFSDKVAGFVQEHPFISFGLGAATLYFGYQMVKGD